MPKRFGIFVDNGCCERTMRLFCTRKLCDRRLQCSARDSRTGQDAQRRNDGLTVRESSSCDYGRRCLCDPSVSSASPQGTVAHCGQCETNCGSATDRPGPREFSTLAEPSETAHAS